MAFVSGRRSHKVKVRNLHVMLYVLQPQIAMVFSSLFMNDFLVVRISQKLMYYIFINCGEIYVSHTNRAHTVLAHFASVSFALPSTAGVGIVCFVSFIHLFFSVSTINLSTYVCFNSLP